MPMSNEWSSSAAACLSPDELSEFNCSSTPMWIFDTSSFAFLAVNDAAVWNYGYTREKFLHMTLLDIRPSEDIVPLIRKELRDGKHYSDHEIWRHRKSDGSVIEVSISSRPITFNNRPAAIVSAEQLRRQPLVGRHTTGGSAERTL